MRVSATALALLLDSATAFVPSVSRNSLLTPESMRGSRGNNNGILFIIPQATKNSPSASGHAEVRPESRLKNSDDFMEDPVIKRRANVSPQTHWSVQPHNNGSTSPPNNRIPNSDSRNDSGEPDFDQMVEAYLLMIKGRLPYKRLTMLNRLNGSFSQGSTWVDFVEHELRITPEVKEQLINMPESASELAAMLFSGEGINSAKNRPRSSTPPRPDVPTSPHSEKIPPPSRPRSRTKGSMPQVNRRPDPRTSSTPFERQAAANSPIERPAAANRPPPVERPAPMNRPPPAEWPASVNRPPPVERPPVVASRPPVERPGPASQPPGWSDDAMTQFSLENAGVDFDEMVEAYLLLMKGQLPFKRLAIMNRLNASFPHGTWVDYVERELRVTPEIKEKIMEMPESATEIAAALFAEEEGTTRRRQTGPTLPIVLLILVGLAGFILSGSPMGGDTNQNYAGVVEQPIKQLKQTADSVNVQETMQGFLHQFAKSSTPSSTKGKSTRTTPTSVAPSPVAPAPAAAHAPDVVAPQPKVEEKVDHVEDVVEESPPVPDLSDWSF